MFKRKLFKIIMTVALFANLISVQKINATESINVNENSKEINNCIQPTKADDRNLIADTVKNLPISKKKLQALHLTRIDSKDKTISLIVPGSWRFLKADTKHHHILYKKEKNSPTVNSELLLTKIPLGKGFVKSYPGVEAIRYYYQNLIGKKAQADVVKALKYITLPDKIYATFARKIKVDSINIYEYHFLMLQNNILFDLSLFGDKQHSNTSKFLAALGIYSMWTKEECFSDKKDSQSKSTTK